MFTQLSLSSTPIRSAKRRSRKLTAKSTLGVETLDARKMLAVMGGYYPMTSSPYLSMPTYSSAYSIPSSYSMPTYGSSSVNAYRSSSVSYPPNPYAASSSVRISTTPATNYSTSNFYGTSSYVTPTYSSYGTSNYSTPLSSSYSYGNSGSYSYNTYSSSPYAYNTYSNNSYASTMASISRLNAANTSNLLSLQAKAFEIQRLGGTVPSSVSNVLNSYSYGGSTSGSASQTSYSQSQIASMVSGGSQYVIKPSSSTYNTSYNPSTAATNRLITSSGSYFVNAMQTAARTGIALGQLVRAY